MEFERIVKEKPKWLDQSHSFNKQKMPNWLEIIVLYIKKVLHKEDHVHDIPCRIDEKIVDKTFEFTNDDNGMQKAHDIKHFYPDDAGSIQIYNGSMNTKIPNDTMNNLKMRFTLSAYDGDTDIVQVLAPFVGNPNAIITINNIPSPCEKSPIEIAIMNGHTEIIRFLASLCDDYNLKKMTLIHLAVIYGNAEVEPLK